MKKQILGLILLTAFLASLMLASAAINFADANTAVTLTQSDTSESFTVITNDLANITHTANGNLTITTSAIVNNTNNVDFTISPAISIPAGLHTYTFSITATNAINSIDLISKTITVTMTNNTNLLCSDSDSELEIDDIEFDVLSGFGDGDDLFFYSLDEVEVTFNLDNTGSYDIGDIEITACLFDETTGDCVLDEDDMDISDDSFDLDAGDDVDVTLTFEIDPDKLDEGDEDYTLYIGATGEIDDSDSADDGDSTCAPGSEEDVEIRTGETFAVITNVIYTENVNCGEMLEISADVFNVGDEDLDDDEVYFEVYSKELGIDKEITFESGIDSMSKETALFSTKMPSNISEKAYNIRLSVLDEDHDVLQNEEDDEAQKLITVNVGKCVDTSSSVSITAELSEDTPKAVVGEQFVVESTVKNTGSLSATYTVSVSGNEAWSEVSSIEPSTFTLASGESKKVSIYFNVESDAKAGNKDFTIKTTSGSKTSEQKVAITLEEGLSSSRIIQHIKANSFIYTIVLINLILLIAIIIVIVKMFGRKSDD